MKARKKIAKGRIAWTATLNDVGCFAVHSFAGGITALKAALPVTHYVMCNVAGCVCSGELAHSKEMALTSVVAFAW